MCTVSFLPVKDKVFITSNRDEKCWRRPALPPDLYPMENTNMVFPKDGDAGGSWIALSNNGNAGVLLNGAFEKHQPGKKYRRSRGLVFLDIMDSRRPLQQFINTSLYGIEPFTLVLWQENNLYECRWDEKEKKFCRALKNYRPHIWSSVTLYDEEVRQKREQWFLHWLNNHPSPSRKEILRFHQFGGEGDNRNDLMMNRDGTVFTVSITSIALNNEGGSLYYHDALNNTASCQRLPFHEHLILA